jgi:hypothetical protein
MGLEMAKDEFDRIVRKSRIESDKFLAKTQELHKLMQLEIEAAKTGEQRKKRVQALVRMLAKRLNQSHAHTIETMKKMRAAMDETPKKKKRKSKR